MSEGSGSLADLSELGLPPGTFLMPDADADADELKPVIDWCYSLHDIAEAHRYVDQGHK